MDIKTIIEDSNEKEILNLLLKNEDEKVIAAIDEKLTQKKNLIKQTAKKNKDENKENLFALTILKLVLTEKIKPTQYSKFAKLNFEGFFTEDILELMRMLYVLEETYDNKEKLILLANTLLECIRDGATYIEKESNNYPENPINAKIWMDGASLRTKVGELAGFFNRKNIDKQELEALFLRSKITNSIMSHYPNLVGPDMIAVAKKLEQLGKVAKAIDFYTAVIQDFPQFLEDIEETEKECNTANETMEYSEEDIVTIQALVDACEGLKRLNTEIDEHLYKRAKDKLKKASNNLN